METIHIVRVIYRHFKGFKTTNIEFADIKMVRKLQQLVSTNGSGKSTFLAELSLTPINKEMFRKLGGKEIHFKVKGKLYIFISDHKGNVLLDGETKEAITQGDTISHYLETVKTMFGYTDYRWKMITGQIEFTKLDKAGRQKWIEEISGIDFDYPFRIYSHIRKTISGIKRAIKEYEAEMANSDAALLGDELRTELETRRTKLGEVVSLIIAEKGATPQGEALKAKIADFQKLDAEFKELKRKVLHSPLRSFEHLNVKSLEEFRARWIAKNGELDTLDVLFQQKEKELREKVELRNKLSTKAKFDMAGAEAQLKENLGQLEELEDLTQCDYTEIYEEILRHIAINKEEIVQNITLAIINTVTAQGGSIRHTLTAEERSALKIRVDARGSEMRKEKDTIAHLEELIESTKNGKNITCPKCSEIFKEGEENLGSLRIKLDESTTNLSNLTVMQDKESSLLEAVNDITNNILQVKSILDKHIKPHSIRYPLDKYLDGTGTLDDLQKSIEFHFEMARNSYRINQHSRLVKELRDEIEYHKNLERLGSAEDYINKCSDLERELIDIREKRQQLAGRLKAESAVGKELRRYVEGLDNFEQMAEKHSEAFRELKADLGNAALGKLLEDLQVEMGKLSTDINNDIVTMGVRDKLYKMLSDNKARLSVLTDLEVAINPSTGIIAEQLIAYCKLFSARTSHTLAQVWGYDMVVNEPVVHPSRGVNYRFPMTIMDDDPISDIACGSTSQRSIVNLAITMTTRSLLDAEAQLLILDEVGMGFDTIHNIALGDFMYKLISESPSNNIMVIHHDQSIRAMLGDCDTISFDPRQVVLDVEYNQNVTFK